MPIIGLTTFRGLVPKLDPRRLGPQQAQTAENCYLLAETLRPFYQPSTIETLPDTSQESIYLWRYDTDKEDWLYWDGDVDVVKGPVREDQYDRIYYTDGDDYPQIKGYDNGVSDRKCYLPSPSKITVTKEQYFDPTVVTAQFRAGTLVHNLPLIGFDREEDQIKFTFSNPSHSADYGSGVISWRYRLTIPNVGSTPTNATDPNYKIYDDTLDLTENGEKYAEFQVIQIEYINYDWDADVRSGWTVPFEVRFTVKMNYERSTTQYLYYTSTFVDDWGMEGPPTTQARDQARAPRFTSWVHEGERVSDIIEWQPGEKLILSIKGATPGGYHISKRRIYRAAAGTDEDNFFFLAEVDEDEDTYTDTKSDAELAEPLPLTQNPPQGLQGLIVMPGGFVAAFKGKELYMSPPYLPHSFPDEYRLTFAWDIVAIASSGNDIIVMTEGNPYYLTGSDPSVMTQTELMVSQSCVSKRGVATVGGLVVYPSPDGLVGVQSGQAKLISEGYYKPKDWRALTPANSIAQAHEFKQSADL